MNQSPGARERAAHAVSRAAVRSVELVVVAVGDLDRRAIAGLRAAADYPRADVVALHIVGSPSEGHQYALGWLDHRLDPIPLHIVERPDGHVDVGVLDFATQQLGRGYRHVHVVVPRLVRRSLMSHWLHDNTACGIARHLDAQPRIDVSLVPFQLG